MGVGFASREKLVPLASSGARTLTPACLALIGATLWLAPSLLAQQRNFLTMNAAIVYARQHSPRLAGKRQSVSTEQAGIAVASSERLPRLNLGAAARGSSQPAETAMGFPLTQLAQIPYGQPFSNGHLNADLRATIPLYTGGRIGSAVNLATARRDLAAIRVRDVERDLDFDVAATYASIVQLDRDIIAAQESVNALIESRRVISQMLDEGKVARVDLLKVDTRLADVQDSTIEFRNAREIEAGQFNALLGRSVDTPVALESDLPSPSIQPSLEQVSGLAHVGNLKSQLAEAELSVAERSVSVAKSAQRPTLSLAIDGTGQSADPFNIYKGGVAGGVVFSFPVFDRTLTHQVEEAKSRELERRADLKQVELDSAQRVRAAYLQVKNSEERIRASETSIGYAREALRIEQEKQQYGRGIIETLLDAQAALLTSEARYFRALADYTTAIAAVTRETGL
ncbi:TolC family protein [soil metagenome]